VGGFGRSLLQISQVRIFIFSLPDATDSHFGHLTASTTYRWSYRTPCDLLGSLMKALGLLWGCGRRARAAAALRCSALNSDQPTWKSKYSFCVLIVVYLHGQSHSKVRFGLSIVYYSLALRAASLALTSVSSQFQPKNAQSCDAVYKRDSYSA
jgi:hypothetical protein